ncbi:MAG: tetratricopeptide repeat protein, partial [Paracoccaceae bacterium]
MASIWMFGCGLGGGQPVGHQSQLAVAEQLILSGQVTQGYRIIDEVNERKIRSPKVRLDVADGYFEVNALLKAEQSYRDAISQGAEVEGLIGLGRVSLARNEAAEARKHFQAALERSENNLAALNGLGVAFDLDGQHAQAQQLYRRVLDVNPVHVDALNNYGLSLVLQGSVQTATRVLTDLTESNLDNP